MKRLLLATSWVLCATSCLGLPDDRADRDATIGHLTTPAMKVDVDEGMACIREVAPGEIHLRAQTPSPRIHIDVTDGAPELRLLLDNVLPDAVVAAKDRATGALLAVTVLAADRPKQRRLALAVPPSRAIDLELHVPDEADRRPYRFAVLADVQEAIEEVGDLYKLLNADPSIRFLLFSGDLTRRGTLEELTEFERREGELTIPLYATLGNHELAASEVYFQRLYGRGSFHFEFRGVHFTLVDSGTATLSPKVYDWLDTWLDQGRSSVHVFATHIPPIDPIGVRNGSFASRAEASKLLAKLASGRVDLTVYGHVHSYYAFANAGIPAYISGGGGAVPEQHDGIGRSFLVVDVDPGDVGREGRVLSVGLVRVPGEN